MSSFDPDLLIRLLPEAASTTGLRIHGLPNRSRQAATVSEASARGQSWTFACRIRAFRNIPSRSPRLAACLSVLCLSLSLSFLRSFFRYFFLSLSLFFLSAGLGGRLATLRHLARPTTHLFMKWSALGHSRLWYKTTEWDPFFRVVTPSLNTKQSHNPCLVPAPRWLSTMVPTRCLHGLFPQAVEKQACSSIAKQENNNEDSLSLSLFPSLRPVSSCILPHSLSLCLVCLSVACSVASER